MRSQPIKDAIVEDDGEYLLLHPDGRITRDARVMISKEEFRQIATGYMCARCYEPLEEAYPDLCPMPGCGFEIKKYQAEYLERHFQGEEWLGPSKRTLDLMDNQIDELNERSKRAHAREEG
jgi:hypothetical protein